MVRFVVTVSLLIALAAWNFPRFQQWNQHNRSVAALAQHDPRDCADEAAKTAPIEQIAANPDEDNASAAPVERPCQLVGRPILPR
jgi:hypothetical protein